MASHALIQTSTTSELSALPAGRAGVRRTLEVMRNAALRAAVHPEIRALALGIVDHLPGKAYRDEAAAVQEYVRQTIRYTRDVRAVEVLQEPLKTLAVGQGDCDDHSTLVAALLTSLGHACRLVAIGFAPGRWAHVLCEVEIKGQWLTVETTEPWPLGHRLPPTAERMVAVVATGADIGFLKKLGKALKRGANSAIKRGNIFQPKKMLAAIKKDVKEVVSFVPAAAAGFASGGPWGAVVAVGAAKVGKEVAHGQKKKLEKQIRAQNAQDLADAGKELADYAGDASKAAAYSQRLQAAKDPNAEAEKILEEINALAKPMLPVPPAAVVAVQPTAETVVAVQKLAPAAVNPAQVVDVSPVAGVVDKLKPYALPIGAGLGAVLLIGALRGRA